jgi:3D (Asp-Asp-Asp) domain-containing protein
MNAMNTTVRTVARTVTLALVCGAVASPLNSEQRKIGRFVVTYYWVIDESTLRYPREKNALLRDRNGKILARTSRKFKNDLLMEGTGLLRRSERRTVTYYGKVNGDDRFRITDAPFGNGIGKCQLEPYRTAAVDPRVIKLGSKLFIPELKGTKLPDGTIHDGYFWAHDRGAFRGNRVDIFTKVGSGATRPFIRKGYRSRSRVTVYVAEEPKPGGCHAR